jgi:4-amino-4-deoxy-L-arabinose transferase-like glycosyltransferase
LDATNHTVIDESSIRYDGWLIVLVCFLLATFGWGLGFYGQRVYVAELHRLHGWPASLISSGTTFYTWPARRWWFSSARRSAASDRAIA